jgi:NADH-quinone oxidoreductase subunit H
VPHPLFAAFDYVPLLPGIVGAAVLIGFLLISAIFSVWLERKVAGRIQDRLGPTRVGGKFGWLQTLADGMKLLVKEDIIPDNADHFMFRVGPYVALAGSFMAFLALPVGLAVVAQNMNIAIFYMLAVMSTEVFGIILAGYGSGSKWSLFGGMREAAQMVSYEVPMAICVLIPVIVAGTMNLTTIAEKQQKLWDWFVFRDPFTFIAGFHTEYSGFRWLVLFMAEYGSMFAVSGIASLLFLGGWGLGFGLELADPDLLGPYLGNVINVIVFVLKGWFLVFVMMWVRWTLPRLRIDQVMMVCLKYLLPISCALLVGVSLWRVFVIDAVQDWFRFALLAVCLVFVAWLVRMWFTFASAPPGSAMPGMWRSAGVSGYQGMKQRP